MIALNLLSPIQKEALRSRVMFAMIERLMIMLASCALLAGILLLGIRIRLTRTLGEVQARQLLSTEYVSVNGEIQRLNDTISRMERIQREVVPVMPLIVDVVDRTPAGITIGNLALDLQAKTLRLTGQASTRAALLAYEEALRSSSFVQTLESPISNLFERTDINFTFSAVPDVERLKKIIEPEPPKAAAPPPSP